MQTIQHMNVSQHALLTLNIFLIQYLEIVFCFVLKDYMLKMTQGLALHIAQLDLPTIIQENVLLYVLKLKKPMLIVIQGHV